ncbi:hypothetical protein ACFYKX_22525 [Cytobacillus sp. FJAT-54145]|uniref:SHOCT domain-containing protein n=1 Tax=Cytobacillus spartinae TaxID=3299023 RepID=A0ABW6KJD4_9BACI
MKRVAQYIIACFVILFPISPLAEENQVLSMEELEIQVMPEFAYHPEDKKEKQPTLLVGYHGTLMNKTEQPQKGQIEIPLPTKEKNFRIGFVADYNRDYTEMNEIEYELDKKNGLISWETSEEIYPGELYKFVIEYYTDQIKTSEDGKSFSYEYKSFADIGITSLIILEPLKAENFKMTPAAESHQQNPYGMNMFMYQLQGMERDEVRKFEIEYKRAETRTTMDIINEMAGNSSESEGVTKENKTLPVVMSISVVGGISILSGAVLMFLLKRKRKIKKPANQVTDQHPNEDKKARLRAMLIEGSISEQEYNDLLKKIGGK